MPDEIAAEIISEIADAADEIIEEHQEQTEIAEEINRALIESIMAGHESRMRDEFETRVASALNETRMELETCRNELAQLSSEMMRLSQTATAAEITAEIALETSLILPPSNLPSEGEEDQNQPEELINPEVQESQPEPSAPLLRKLKRRLL